MRDQEINSYADIGAPDEPQQHCEHCQCEVNIEDEDKTYPIDYNARSAEHEATAWVCRQCADEEGITDPREGPQSP